MRISFFLLLLFSMSFLSCASYTSMVNANENVGNVKLGMTKEQVVSFMGTTTLRLSGVSKNETGLLVEKIWYPATQQSIYYFTFVDDKLVEWRERFILSNDKHLEE